MCLRSLFLLLSWCCGLLFVCVRLLLCVRCYLFMVLVVCLFVAPPPGLLFLFLLCVVVLLFCVAVGFDCCDLFRLWCLLCAFPGLLCIIVCVRFAVDSFLCVFVVVCVFVWLCLFLLMCLLFFVSLVCYCVCCCLCVCVFVVSVSVFLGC